MDKYILASVVVFAFMSVPAVARVYGPIGPNAPTWRKTLVFAVWGAAFLMAFPSLTQSFDAWPLGIGGAASVGALFGAISGLVLSFMDFRARRRAD